MIFAYGKARTLLAAILLLIALQMLSQDLFAARDVKRPEAVFRAPPRDLNEPQPRLENEP